MSDTRGVDQQHLTGAAHVEFTRGLQPIAPNPKILTEGLQPVEPRPQPPRDQGNRN